MQKQRPGRVPNEPRHARAAARCKQCALEYPHRAATVLAYGYGPTRFSDVRSAPPELLAPSFGRDAFGELTVLPTSASLDPFRTNVRVMRGAVVVLKRDAPRQLPIAEVVRQILRLRPNLTRAVAEEKARQYVATTRTSESQSRTSFHDVEEVDGHLTLECRGCGARPQIRLDVLRTALEKAIEEGKVVYVSPGGAVSRG